MLQSSLPTFIFRHLFYRPAAGTPPKENSKFEARSSKQARNPNGAQFFEFRVSELFRVSNFEFENGSGSGSRTHLNEFIPDKSGCALVEFPAINWWSPAGNAPAWHCLQGRRFTFQPRPHELAGRLGAAPSKLSFGDSVAQAGARPEIKLVRLPGVAPDMRHGTAPFCY